MVKGYYFNTDDQAEHLPQVYQILDSELYPNDYFVPLSNSILTVRYFFERLMLVAESSFGIEVLCFILIILSLTLLARSIMGIADFFFPKTEVKWLAPILVFFVFYGFTVGGNHITYPSLISSTLAKAFAAFSFWKFLQRKYLLAGLILGLGALFQPLVGLQLGLLLMGAQFLLRPKDYSALVKFIIPFGLIVSIILVPVLLRQHGQKPLESELYWEILYRFRNYHHYYPSLFPTGHVIKAIGLAIVGVIIFTFLRPKNYRFYLLFIALSFVGMIVYTVGLELNLLPQVGKTQWFKTSIWVGLLSSVGVAGLLLQLPKVSGIIKVLLPNSYLLVALVFSGLVLLLNTSSMPNSSGKYMIGNRTVSELEKMHNWIDQNTEKDVLVLVPPNDNSFTCQAKRSIPIHFTAIIHEPEFMLEWYQRYSRIYGVTIENMVENAKEDAVVKYSTRNYHEPEYKIDMRLDNLESCQFEDELGPIIHQEGSWVLTEFITEN